MQRYRRFLTDRGIIHLKTDSNFLFTYTKAMVEKNLLPTEALTEDLYQDKGEQGAAHDAQLEEAASIQTYYEQMWLARGLNIRYMKFLLPHEGELLEPEIEIELDDYRSYHRSKRSSLTTSK